MKVKFLYVLFVPIESDDPTKLKMNITDPLEITSHANKKPLTVHWKVWTPVLLGHKVPNGSHDSTIPFFKTPNSVTVLSPIKPVDQLRQYLALHSPTLT